MLKLLRLTIIAVITAVSVYGCAAPAIVAGGAVAGATAVDRRNTEEIVTDNNIELKIKEAIYTDDSIKRHIHVNVTSYHGAVLVSGETPTMAMRDKVVRYAQHVDKVKKIYNETVVAPASEFKSRRQDTWITTKAKSILLGTKHINALHFKVVTENQVVYLMGVVTKKEGDIAANAIRQVDGVKQIVKLFEYVSPAPSK